MIKSLNDGIPKCNQTASTKAQKNKKAKYVPHDSVILNSEGFKNCTSILESEWVDSLYVDFVVIQNGPTNI